MAKEIRITDNFMFATVMKNENICRPFIERMLGISVEKIEYLEREKDLRADPFSKGIRLDVYVKDSNRVFTLEMQCSNRKDLSLRTRYYQGLQDISFLDKGTFTGIFRSPTFFSYAFLTSLEKNCRYILLKTSAVKTRGFC